MSALEALARALRFDVSAPLDAGARRALGVPASCTDVRVAAGRGAARALLCVVAPSERTLADETRRIATRLAARAPQILWLALVTCPARRQTVVAAWGSDRSPPRPALLTIDPGRTLASDVDTLSALAAAAASEDLLMHGRWLEVLGREAISRRFYHALERLVAALAESAPPQVALAPRREIALLNVSRLLFLAFLETRGWLDGDRDFLVHQFDLCMQRGGGFQRRVLQPLFFGTLNTPHSKRAPAARALGRVPFLNGGLFQRSLAEKIHRGVAFGDAEWGRLFDKLLVRYRFTAREESGDWSETAVDPEMLGRAFESLMMASDRRESGAFYTPFALVERTTTAALEGWLERHGFEEAAVRRVLQGEPLPAGDAARLGALLPSARVLDPACGSGAFLVHALDRLTQLWQLASPASPRDEVRRRVLTESLFGVDVNPTAVWLCELRLWLAVVLDQETTDPRRVTPLPNLDHNIRCGDSLAGGDFSLAVVSHGAGELARLRLRYARATGPRKRSLVRALERLERAHHVAWLDSRCALLSERRRALVVAARGRDLFGGRRGAVAAEREALRALRAQVRGVRAQCRAARGGGALPFSYAARFPDVAAAGGFTLVLGNPPWVRLHRIPAPERERFAREFFAFREAAWEAGGRDARAGRGFAAQADLAALFVERGLQLLAPDGVLSLIVPAKLWRALAGGGVRRLVRDRHELVALEDWSEAPPAFEAATYPSLVVARRRADAVSVPAAPPVAARVAVHRGRLSVCWRASAATLPLDATPGAPWVALPDDARRAFDVLARRGVPLVRAGIGHPTLGVKCGCNEAFLVRLLGHRGRCAVVGDGTRTVEVERDWVRPVLRGEAVRPWTAAEATAHMIFPGDDEGRTRTPLPAGVRAWLVPWRAQLARRADARGSRAWWSVFRTEGASARAPRVVWADVARTPQAVVLPAGDPTVPLNSCYVLRTRDLTDALTLAALLNSSLAAAWLGALAEPARGGYRRHLAWTMARLPLPDDWARARALLAPLAERARSGAPPPREALLEAVLDAYRLRRATVLPLLAWLGWS